MSLFSAMADEDSVWAQGSSLFNVSSPLNDLLEKDDFTLEQVLQEDELVQEVKTRNTKLIDLYDQFRVLICQKKNRVVAVPLTTCVCIRVFAFVLVSSPVFGSLCVFYFWVCSISGWVFYMLFFVASRRN